MKVRAATWMGLYIVREIAAAHGELGARSVAGETVFTANEEPRSAERRITDDIAATAYPFSSPSRDMEKWCEEIRIR
jgi:hypothetical protein